MLRKKKPILPVSGSAFAFRLDDGRYSVCRVLLDTTSDQSKQLSSHPVLVACSAWIGDRVPSASDPALRPTLILNHHSWNNRPEILWISEAVPKHFVPIGNIAPTAEEQSMECGSFGDWLALTQQPLRQWRWDNERDAVLAEDVIRKKEEAKATRKAQEERNTYLKGLTLAKLRNHQFFKRWKGYPSTKAIRASRKIMSRTIEQLAQLRAGGSIKARMAILQQCIEAFNELDEELSFIETVEREDICEEFEAIVHACGLGTHRHLADRWRDW